MRLCRPTVILLQPEVLEPQAQNVYRRVLISIKYETAMRTVMHPNTQLLLDQLTAVGVRAHLGCVAGVDQHHRSSSLFRFGARVLYQLRPSNVSNALAHPTSAAHVQRFQFFKRNYLIACYQLATLLVRKVASAVSDPLMDMGQRLLAMPVVIPLLVVALYDRPQ